MTAFIAFCGSQHLAQKFNLWPFVAAENRFRGLGGFDAGAHQFGSDLESALGRIRVVK